jgi:hypothetical protein
MRSGTAELDRDSCIAANPLPNRDYTALLLCLIPRVCQEQPLAARDRAAQRKQRSVLADFDCVGLFVEWLFFRVQAVNE